MPELPSTQRRTKGQSRGEKGLKTHTGMKKFKTKHQLMKKTMKKKSRVAGPIPKTYTA